MPKLCPSNLISRRCAHVLHATARPGRRTESGSEVTHSTRDCRGRKYRAGGNKVGNEGPGSRPASREWLLVRQPRERILPRILQGNQKRERNPLSSDVRGQASDRKPHASLSEVFCFNLKFSEASKINFLSKVRGEYENRTELYEKYCEGDSQYSTMKFTKKEILTTR